MVNLKLVPVDQEHFDILSNLSKYYTYDISEFADEFPGYDCNQSGEYSESVTEYRNDPACKSILLQVDGKWAGFAIVKKLSGDDSETAQHVSEIAEFFVVRKYRRQGVATRFAHSVFDEYIGAWEVSVWPKNIPATAFWERVISSYQVHGVTQCQEHHPSYGCEMITYRFKS